MNVTVIYPQDKTFEIEIPQRVENSIDSALSWVWRECQGGISETLGRLTEVDKLNIKGCKLRSSMVGDIYTLYSRYFIVDGFGFVEVDKDLAERWQKLPERDIVMGWGWCRGHHNLGLHIQIIT